MKRNATTLKSWLFGMAKWLKGGLLNRKTNGSESSEISICIGKFKIVFRKRHEAHWDDDSNKAKDHVG